MLCQQKNEIKSEKIKPHRALQSIFGFWGVKLPRYCSVRVVLFYTHFMAPSTKTPEYIRVFITLEYLT